MIVVIMVVVMVDMDREVGKRGNDGDSLSGV